ncbi:hypothetical protein M0802_015558 [Mischocyttarus mexicanus]|nr:hypothetical protein M0802_015558 [Mischocyttarus mexicanus]
MIKAKEEKQEEKWRNRKTEERKNKCVPDVALKSIRQTSQLDLSRSFSHYNTNTNISAANAVGDGSSGADAAGTTILDQFCKSVERHQIAAYDYSFDKYDAHKSRSASVGLHRRQWLAPDTLPT